MCSESASHTHTELRFGQESVLRGLADATELDSVVPGGAGPRCLSGSGLCEADSDVSEFGRPRFRTLCPFYPLPSSTL